jgi:radical SAM superfamily enzyme YgiQ (UPF0313 family)
MRILMVAANQEQKPDPVVPLGASLVAGALRRAGHDVGFLDCCFSGSACYGELETRLAEGWDVVGLSMRNVDDVAWPRATAFVGHYRELSAVVRRVAPQATLILGGSAFTLFPELYLRELAADYGVVGEGEAASAALLADLATGRRPPHGVGPESGRLVVAPPLAAGDLDGDPADDLVDLGRYLRSGGAVNLQTKRGCAFRCNFCTYPQLEGARARPGDPQRCVDRMARLQAAYGIDSFFVVDNTFNMPRSHALAFCRALAERRLGVRWTAYCTPAGMDRELLDAMLASGCTSIELGTDAAHPDTLRGLDKSFTVEDIRRVSADCRAAGMAFCHSLILGGPGETPDTLAATVAEMDACQARAVVAMLGVRLYPGTALARRLAAEGVLRLADIGLDPLFFISEPVRDDLEQRARAVVAERPHWFIPGLEGRRRPRAHDRLRQQGVRGPLWELSRVER